MTALAVSPGFTNDGLALAATLKDGGMSWQAWNFGLLDWNVYCLAVSPNFLHDHMVFIGVETGVYRSTNGGRSWRDLSFSEDAVPVSRDRFIANLFPGWRDYGRHGRNGQLPVR